MLSWKWNEKQVFNCSFFRGEICSFKIWCEIKVDEIQHVNHHLMTWGMTFLKWFVSLESSVPPRTFSISPSAPPWFLTWHVSLDTGVVPFGQGKIPVLSVSCKVACDTIFTDLIVINTLFNSHSVVRISFPSWWIFYDDPVSSTRLWQLELVYYPTRFVWYFKLRQGFKTDFLYNFRVYLYPLKRDQHWWSNVLKTRKGRADRVT